MQQDLRFLQRLVQRIPPQYIRRISRREVLETSAKVINRFSPHLIINLDETPLPFEFLEGYTYDHKGSRSVQAKSARSGWDKRQATLILSILADGSFSSYLRPVIIFHGLGNVISKEGSEYHPGVIVKFNEKAYNNEDLFE
ncbi:hypothetical protein F4861DRAFT_544680, partial [Xylaria intraflava]